MRAYFLFLNVLAFFCVIALVAAHVRHQSPPPSPLLASRPDKPSINPQGVLAARGLREPPQLAVIAEQDLFDPSRGRTEAAPDAGNPAAQAQQRRQLDQLELLGVVKMGTMEGVVVQDRTGKTAKKFFRVGGKEDVGGFKLVKIDAVADTATFSADGREYELKLERNSKTAEQRRQQAQRQEPIVTFEPRPAGTPGTPATATATPPNMGMPPPSADRPPEVQKALEVLRRHAEEQQKLRAQQLQQQQSQPPPGAANNSRNMLQPATNIQR